MFGGACAGLAVDLLLFPMDTIKTRLQSERGFRGCGGFSRIYSGVPSVALGSAPGSALFFSSYEAVKQLLLPFSPHPSLAHMTAASFAELVACLVRVPTEVCKQRAQASPNRRLHFIVAQVMHSEGFAGFYRGYRSTVLREIPFSLTQFPLWELFKSEWSWLRQQNLSPFQSACCGAVAGVIASGITTPLDVAKTRIMLADRLHGHADGRILQVLKDVWAVQGFRGVFAGFWPRITWMGIGGFVFFGAYEGAKSLYSVLSVPGDESYLSSEAVSWYGMERWRDKFQNFLRTGSFKEKPMRTFDEALEETRKVIEEREDFMRRRKIALQQEEDKRRKTVAACRNAS